MFQQGIVEYSITVLDNCWPVYIGKQCPCWRHNRIFWAITSQSKILSLAWNVFSIPICQDLREGSGDWEASFVLLSLLLLYFEFCVHLSHGEESKKLVSDHWLIWLCSCFCYYWKPRGWKLSKAGNYSAETYRGVPSIITANDFSMFWTWISIFSSLTLDHVWEQTAPDRIKLRSSLSFTPETDEVLWKCKLSKIQHE